MSEMVERVALAIADVLMHDESSFHEAARAVIEAMREPTEEMADEADETINKCLNEPVEIPSARNIWIEMIDKALGEPLAKSPEL